MTNETKTIRVRIAVAADVDGAWEAFGAHDASDDVTARNVREWLQRPQAPVTFVEATIPLPESVTVEGEVSEP